MSSETKPTHKSAIESIRLETAKEGRWCTYCGEMDHVPEVRIFIILFAGDDFTSICEPCQQKIGARG